MIEIKQVENSNQKEPKLNLYKVAMVICVVLILISAIVILCISSNNKQDGKIEIATTNIKEDENITQENAIKLAISQFKKLGEKNLKEDNITISEVERNGEYYYYVCSPENTLEIKITGGKITRVNSVPVENL